MLFRTLSTLKELYLFDDKPLNNFCLVLMFIHNLLYKDHSFSFLNALTLYCKMKLLKCYHNQDFLYNIIKPPLNPIFNIKNVYYTLAFIASFPLIFSFSAFFFFTSNSEFLS